MGVPGKGGRPRKPSNLRSVDGDKANRFNDSEPKPGLSAVVAPRWLSAADPAGEDWPELGEAIRAARTAAGWTQQELGKRLNVSARRISAWERTGQVSPAWVSDLQAYLGEDLVLPEASRPETGLDVWDRLAPDLEAKGVLTPWDVDSFAILCDAIVGYRKAAREVLNRGLIVMGMHGRVKNPACQLQRDYADTIVKVGARFGMTPSDRAGLKIERDDPGGGAERLLS